MNTSSTSSERTISVAKASFLASASAMPQLPAAQAPEVAFVGRSNVGKSSLMNMLMGQRGLVKTSRTPGRTRLINLFPVTLQLRRAQRDVVLVDLPGYGFAKMSQTDQAAMSKLLSDYLGLREGLAVICHLFDLRHEPTKLDLETWNTLADFGVSRVAVATKADKVPSTKRGAHRRAIAKALQIEATAVVSFSSETGDGRNPLWNRILDEIPAA